MTNNGSFVNSHLTVGMNAALKIAIIGYNGIDASDFLQATGGVAITTGVPWAIGFTIDGPNDIMKIYQAKTTDANILEVGSYDLQSKTGLGYLGNLVENPVNRLNRHALTSCPGGQLWTFLVY